MVFSVVAPGVLVIDTQVADGKAGVIAGSEVALAVDAGIDDHEGATVLRAAESLDRDRVELVYTHGHTDHALGGTVFHGHPIHARREVAPYMRSQLEAWSARSSETADALATRLGWPTHVFEHETTLALGDRTVRLLDTPGHAPGAICVFDSEAGVLFGGDTVVTAIPPAFSDGDSGVLERSLWALAELDAELLVPGHGAVVHGRQAVRNAITWSAEYLARCRAHVRSHPDLPLDGLIAAAPFDDYLGDHLPDDRFRMRWRHEQTIRRMSEELERASN